MLTGLLTYSSMPISKYLSRSPLIAWAVTATIYGSLSDDMDSLIALTASIPSMNGIWISMNTISYG